jgi:hypothetical protein
MPLFGAVVACDPSAYLELEGDAETWEAFAATITPEKIEEACRWSDKVEIEYAGAAAHRVLTVYPLDDDGLAGETLAEDIDLDPTPIESMRAALLEAVTGGSDALAAQCRFNLIAHATRALREARDALAATGSAPRALDRVRAALRSTEGAKRHADGLRWRPPVHACEGCGRPEADCSAAPCADVIADREA